MDNPVIEMLARSIERVLLRYNYVKAEDPAEETRGRTDVRKGFFIDNTANLHFDYTIQDGIDRISLTAQAYRREAPTKTGNPFKYDAPVNPGKVLDNKILDDMLLDFTEHVKYINERVK